MSTDCARALVWPVLSAAIALASCARPMAGNADPNVLQFRLVTNAAGEGTEPMTLREGGKEEVLHLRKEALLNAADVQSARAATDSTGAATVYLVFTKEGEREFLEATKANIGRRLAIVVEGRLLSAPVILAAIKGAAVIAGQFTREETRAIADKINAARKGR